MSDRRVKYIILASIIFVGIVGISQGQGLFELNDAKTIIPKTGLGYLGHVTVFLKDPDGNIQGYYQGDNLVLDRGVNCGSDLVFDTNFVSGTCNFVKFMAIGSSTAIILGIQTDLLDKTANGNELATISDIVASDTNASFFSADLVLSNTFFIPAADDGDAIGEAGLFDSSETATANIFARTLIGPFTMVTSGSQVTVIWTIHVN